MKKLITICLVCVLTAAAWGTPVSNGNININIIFNENGNGNFNGTPLVWDMGIPLQAGRNDQYATLYYELPSLVVEGDLVLYEPDQPTGDIVSDVLRFVNVRGVTGAPIEGRAYVYSDIEQGEKSTDLADTRIPYDYLPNSAGTEEQGTEDGWNGIVYTPWYSPEVQQYLPGYMMQYGENGVTYNFTSDIPEPATIALLGLGALSVIRRKRSV